MEQNSQTPPVSNQQVASQPQPVVSSGPLPQTPPIMPPQVEPVVSTPQPEQPHGNKKMLKLFLLIVVLAILALGAFFGYSYFNTQKTYNAGVYTYPTSSPVSPTPGNNLNPNDTSNSSIDSNNQVADQNLKTLDSSLNTVTDSLNDKQTNLQ